MKIGIVGTYPPPYGGISMHIQRLEALLEQDGHEPTVFPNISARKWLVDAWGKWFSYDIVHFHDISWRSRVLIGLMGTFGLNAVLTIHGDSLQNQLSGAGWLKRSLLCFSLRRIPHIVVVKAEIRDLLLSLGIEPSRVSVINAYIPPVFGHEAPLPNEIREFVETCSSLIVANAFDVIPLSDRTDLYGIEMTIELCSRLVGDHPRIGCVFFLAQISDQIRYAKLVARVSELGLDRHFRFVIGESLTPTLKVATLFVRPTSQDGFSVSVAEAVSLGVPVLASDVCTRGEGVFTFVYGDLVDYEQRTRSILGDYAAVRQAVQEIEPASAYAPLLAIYQRVAASKNRTLASAW